MNMLWSKRLGDGQLDNSITTGCRLKETPVRSMINHRHIDEEETLHDGRSDRLPTIFAGLLMTPNLKMSFQLGIFIYFTVQATHWLTAGVVNDARKWAVFWAVKQLVLKRSTCWFQVKHELNGKIWSVWFPPALGSSFAKNQLLFLPTWPVRHAFHNPEVSALTALGKTGPCVLFLLCLILDAKCPPWSWHVATCPEQFSSPGCPGNPFRQDDAVNGRRQVLLPLRICGAWQLKRLGLRRT